MAGSKLMSAPLPWVERCFAFDLPEGLFPELLERLRGTPARLEELVREAPPDALTRRYAGSWSIQENVGHLRDLEALFAGRLDDFEAGLDELRPADMSNRATEEADHNTRALTELLGEFRSRRQKLVRRLEGLPETVVGRAAYHRRLGVWMRLVDQMYFHAEHDDHHLARIRWLIGRLN